MLLVLLLAQNLIIVLPIMQIDGDIMRTIKFVDSLKIPYIAPSFGGCESVVNQPAIMSYWYLLWITIQMHHDSTQIHHREKMDILTINLPCVFCNRDLPRQERAKYRINDNLVRFCFGVEDFEDMRDDILQALDAI